MISAYICVYRSELSPKEMRVIYDALERDEQGGGRSGVTLGGP